MKYGSLIVEKKEYLVIKRILNFHKHYEDVAHKNALAQLSNKMEQAIIVGDDEMPKDVVRLYSEVRVSTINDAVQHYQLVMPMEENLKDGSLSVVSTLGAKLIGLASGDEIKNETNSDSFKILEQTVSSVYEDRLVAQEYIYQLNNLFHDKEMQFSNASLQQKKDVVTDNINQIFNDFADTELTAKELVYFTELRNNFDQLQQLESQMADESGFISQRNKVLEAINSNLDELAEVQLTEAQQLTHRSQKSLKVSKLLSSLEIGFLTVIGILFLFIVFYPNKRPNWY
ncbi:GreA/GreB family elongation factor [Flagellimonas zhangzhouensis]|uniref:GreA/GreB family elongation factor n=1 Tax=Flagellimonas zhangzhouensis TaxID=1073328 RepID=UPI0015867DEB|nr:GreA/GreB family elongation factor [Allomuricauda zhangzhouensis]